MTSAKLERKRHCGPKVKSGCQTCKIRRVKCDESKPSCKRCTSTGRKCEGYPSQSLLLSTDPERATAAIQRLAIHTPGNAEEKRGFQYFIKNTAVELSGYFDKSFWEHLLLQTSSSEPALRHAVVAIGSLHENFKNMQIDYSPESADFAMKQYTKAIQHLRKSLSAGNNTPLMALMSCVLFVSFDSIKGRFSSAMIHLRGGLGILRDLREEGLHNDLIENTIAPLFRRLCVQSILYIDTRDEGDRQAFAAELMRPSFREEQIPETFKSLDEARNYMNQAADGLFRVFYISDGDLPHSLQPVESFELHEKYSAQLREWNVAYEKLIKVKSREFDSKEIRGAALLKIQHLVINVMAAVGTPDLEDPRTVTDIMNSPGGFKPFKNDFQTVVNLSKSIIAAAEQDAKAGKSSLTFSTDMGLIGPLYYVCTHCHDRNVRNEAFALLSRCPRREGMWDATRISSMIKQYWAIEETHNSLPPELDAMPISAMLMLKMRDGLVWEWGWREPCASWTKSSLPDSTLTEISDDNSSMPTWCQVPKYLDLTGS